jgi:DNA-binding LacI/PurR family transcriptional regulator
MGTDDQDGNPRSPTLQDVAAAAGVSRSTASRAINGGRRVSPAAQAAVDAAVQLLGFTPNRAARALVTNRANSIALVIPEPQRAVGDPFFASVIQGVGQALDDTDVQAILVMARPGDAAERAGRYLRRGQVDGLLMVAHRGANDIEEALAASPVPSVFIGRPWQLSDDLSYVATDNRLGAELATRHLLERGRQLIGSVAGPAETTAAMDRLAGLASALKAAGRRSGGVEHGDFSTPGGAEATRRLLDRSPDLDAIFVANDLMAVGALDVLRSTGRSVPADVAIVGYDDAAVAAVTDPPLTTVVNPAIAIARAATLLLLGRIASGEPAGLPIIFPPELIVRSSS